MRKENILIIIDPPLGEDNCWIFQLKTSNSKEERVQSARDSISFKVLSKPVHTLLKNADDSKDEQEGIFRFCGHGSMNTGTVKM